MDQLVERLPLPLALLLGLGMLVTLADGLWFFLGGAETGAVPVDTSVAAGAPGATQRGAVLSARQLAALNLFGDPAAGPAAASVDAPETRLQLELRGVFMADRAAASSAIVAEANREGRLFFVGDTLPGNAVLEQVLEDRILLRRDGRLETLRFPEAGAARGFVAVDDDTPPLQLEPGSDSLVDGGGDGSASSQAAQARTELRELVARYEQQLDTDPEGTLASLGVAPVSAGAAEGYRVDSGASSAMLSRVGLKPGDVVLSVNGQPVGDVMQDRSMLDGVLDNGMARLEIQRADRRFFVTTRLQ